MFGRRQKLKQTVALGAVLLALSTLAQGSGVLCLLHMGGEAKAADVGSPHAGCHNHCCHHASPASMPGDEQGDRGELPCPCPEGCWCHQPPQPLELPKAFDYQAGPSQFAGLLALDQDLFSGVQDAHALRRCAPPTGVDEGSAIYRCALLCRFLI